MSRRPRSQQVRALGTGAALLLALGAGCFAPAPASVRPERQGDTPLLRETFDEPASAGRVARLRSRLAVIVPGEGVGGTDALRVTYFGTKQGSARVTGRMPLPRPLLEATLSYDVRFDRDFQFVRGGKLHGLGPARVVSGGERSLPDGWSARVMWRRDGRPETYTYHQDRADEWGDSGSREGSFTFSRGRYQAVSLHVRLNQPAEAANGFVRLYVDGRLVSRQKGLRFRAIDTPDSRIATFLFSTFHGGHDPSWAPRNPDGSYAEVHALLDNVEIHPGEHIRPRPGA